MKLTKIKGNKELIENGVEIHCPGELGDDISIYTNNWVSGYRIKLLKNKRPYLEYTGSERAFR